MKHAARTLLLLLAFAPGLLAQKGGECATCKGKREVNCCICEGKGTFDAPCPLCVGREPVDCLSCGGKGGVECAKCQGLERAYQGGSSRNCVACKGRHTIRCQLCEKGKLPCACKGTQKAKRGCSFCSGLKKLPCPECGVAPEACPACKGEKNEPCPICAGSKKAPAQCMTCRGAGISPCGSCFGLGQTFCQQCNHQGRVESAICPKCRGKAMLPCATCKGKGNAACPTCAGGGGEGPCWACHSVGTIACRRCAEPRKMWSGKDEATGARIAVFSVAEYEPQILSEMGVSFLTLQPVLWRVVIDNRDSKSSFPLGTDKGWMLSGVELTDHPCVVGPSRLPANDQAKFAAILGLCGLGKDAGKYPITASPGQALTVVLWEGGDPDPSMKSFSLRKGTTELPLVEGTATWFDWYRVLYPARPRR